jgi:nucleoside-diphosphate-sugar epimerase
MNLKNKKILVTGSDGFVGTHLISRLKEEGAEIICFSKSLGKDILKEESFKNLPKIDIVYHLAAITYVPFAQENPKKTFETNILGTINVLEFCRKTKAKMIFASSYVYGTPRYLPIDEKHKLNPTNNYAESKVIGEMLCKRYHSDYDVKCIIFRVFNIYGPNQNNLFLIPTIINQLDKPEIRLNYLAPKRDYLHIYDLIDAYILAGNYESEKIEIFNVGYGKSYSVKQIVDTILKIAKKDIKINSLELKRKGEIMDCSADITKIRNKLGWKPSIVIEKGLEMIINGKKR